MKDHGVLEPYIVFHMGAVTAIGFLALCLFSFMTRCLQVADAADFAALAGVQSEHQCDVAREAARRNHAELLSCTGGDGDIRVVVRMDSRLPEAVRKFGLPAYVTGAAHAAI